MNTTGIKGASSVVVGILEQNTKKSLILFYAPVPSVDIGGMKNP